MRLYATGMTRETLRKARGLAPSHVFGVVWTPADRRLADIPYIVDNGAYTSSFHPEEWIDLLDSLSSYAYGPDFVVLPDGYNDAEKTLERHRKWVGEVHDRGLTAAAVIQPGMDVRTQADLASRIGAKFAFVGGEKRWKRAHIPEIVEAAHSRGLKVHIGNPGGEDGLISAYRCGVDSVDTTTIKQNGYWHYLERLEDVTDSGLNTHSLKNDTRQSTLGETA